MKACATANDASASENTNCTRGMGTANASRKTGSAGSMGSVSSGKLQLHRQTSSMAMGVNRSSCFMAPNALTHALAASSRVHREKSGSVSPATAKRLRPADFAR